MEKELGFYEKKEAAKFLADLEVEIEDGQQAVIHGFIKIGNALKKIRDDRYYKATHSTFEIYCQERWSLGRNYVNKQISAAEYSEVLGTKVPIPVHETHVRELIGLAPEDAVKVIETAKAIAPGRTGAKHIKQARQQLFPKPASKTALVTRVVPDLPAEESAIPAKKADSMIAKTVRQEFERVRNGFKREDLYGAVAQAVVDNHNKADDPAEFRKMIQTYYELLDDLNDLSDLFNKPEFAQEQNKTGARAARRR